METGWVLGELGDVDAGGGDVGRGGVSGLEGESVDVGAGECGEEDGCPEGGGSHFDRPGVGEYRLRSWFEASWYCWIRSGS